MKIVFLDFKTLGNEDISAFKEFGELYLYEQTKPCDIVKNIADAEVIVINKIQITEEILKSCPNLKLILISATGMNNVDLNAAKNLGIKVKNVAGYSTKSVAQHTFALLLSLMNATIYYDEFTKSEKWVNSDLFCDFSRRIYTINGKTWGIIGLGAIGLEVAKIASLFGAKVIYTSISQNNKNTDYPQVSLEELLKSSDIISIHTPLSEKTLNLISEKELNLLKNNAYLINVARGGIIDEKALAKALDEKDIKVGLDVLSSEPMNKDNPLLKIKNKSNLLITPHIAWTSCESVKTLVSMLLDNLKGYLDEK